MKEELIKFMEEQQVLGYRLDAGPEQLVRECIDQFFDQYQPERSKREDVFVVRGSKECIAIDATPSKECREYHQNSCIQINGQLKRCGALNTVETS